MAGNDYQPFHFYAICSMAFLDVIETRTSFKPDNLLIVVSMFGQNLLRGTVDMVQNKFQWFAGGEMLKINDIDPVLLLNQVVIFRFAKVNASIPFFEIRFMNPCEGARQYCPNTQMARFHGCMFPG